MVDLGLIDLGYNFATVDCGWNSRDRDAEGRLQWNETLFPSGGKALGDYLHGLGLGFGLYSGAGYFQCGSTDLPASLGGCLAAVGTRRWLTIFKVSSNLMRRASLNGAETV
jgi:alpha-galactosidase